MELAGTVGLLALALGFAALALAFATGKTQAFEDACFAANSRSLQRLTRGRAPIVQANDPRLRTTRLIMRAGTAGVLFGWSAGLVSFAIARLD
jgi:hypothetical protein